jgi:hypothetical protein
MGARRPNARTRANRQNAKASTGPKSDLGKQRSSKNAMTHGLSCPGVGREWHRSIDELARDIAGPHALSSEMVFVREIARCELDLMHARQVRTRLWRYADRTKKDRTLLKTPFRGQGQIFEHLEPVFFQDPLGEFPNWKIRQIERRRRNHFIKLNQFRDPLEQLRRLDRYEATIRRQRADAMECLDRMKAKAIDATKLTLDF